MRISDWSSDVCSSDLAEEAEIHRVHHAHRARSVHSEREHRAPVHRVVAEGKAADDMSPDREYQQHRDPQLPGGPEEQGKTFMNGRQNGKGQGWNSSNNSPLHNLSPPGNKKTKTNEMHTTRQTQ